MKTMNLQVTSGRGPAECAWVAAQVVKAIRSEADGSAIACTVLSRERGPENGTVSSAIIQLEGAAAKEFAQTWMGTIQWVGQSPFRKFHKRKNWFVGVALLSNGAEQRQFLEKDVRFECFRASGPGGQNVNKVNTAVRAIHQPSGMATTASEERSQWRNKRLAVQKLQKLWDEASEQSLCEQAQEGWQQHTALKRGNPVKTFNGRSFKQLKK